MDGAEAGEGVTRSILRSYVRSHALAGDRARREKIPAEVDLPPRVILLV